MKKILVHLFLIIVIFQIPLSNAIPIFKYLDEFITVLLGFLLIFVVIKNPNNMNILFLLLFAALIFFGLIGNFLYKYQSLNLVMMDVLLYSKFWIPLFFFYFLKIDCNKIFNLLDGRFFKLLSIVMGGLVLIDQIFGVFPSFGNTWIFRNEQLFFGHETFYVAYMIVILFLSYISIKENRRIYIGLDLFLILLSFKSKAFIFIALFLGYCVFKDERMKNIKILKLFIITICIVFSVYFFYDKYVFYTETYEESARSVLITKSFVIANHYMPFGTGFATYGSYPSTINYSIVYNEFGVSGIHGLSQANPKYISDNFWPMIVGQGGYVSLFIYIMLLIIVIKDAIKNKSISIILLMYMIVASLAESAFVNNYGALYGILIGVTINKCIVSQYSKNESVYYEKNFINL